jgi:uncharacterized protein with NRDE domain
MCTLVFAHRNEFLARPARGPLIAPGPVPALMPRDLKGGGTWLGVNARGVFACLTNRRGAGLDPSRASRGAIVVDALRAASACEVKERIAQVPGNRYNGFHLLFADSREAWVAICDGSRLELRSILPGRVLVVTERSYGAGEGTREAEVTRQSAPLFSVRGLSASMLRPPMQHHGQVPLEGACVHADDLGYGTRSSLQLVVRDNGAVEFLWTEGHPCTAEISDLSAQATALLKSGPTSS